MHSIDFVGNHDQSQQLNKIVSQSYVSISFPQTQSFSNYYLRFISKFLSHRLLSKHFSLFELYSVFWNNIRCIQPKCRCRTIKICCNSVHFIRDINLTFNLNSENSNFQPYRYGWHQKTDMYNHTDSIKSLSLSLNTHSDVTFQYFIHALNYKHS